jgi:hypothetical protein
LHALCGARELLLFEPSTSCVLVITIVPRHRTIPRVRAEEAKISRLSSTAGEFFAAKRRNPVKRGANRVR